MNGLLKMRGIVLSVSAVKEYDKRLVILTGSRGKITAFAKGVRRPGSQLMAAANPFVCGDFYFYEGRSSYTLKDAEIINYFEFMRSDLEGVCYGSYFAEMADYYSRENLADVQMLNLLYVALCALGRPSLPDELVRYIYELKMMVINGEYTVEPPMKTAESVRYAWQFVVRTPVEKLFTFVLNRETLEEFARAVTCLRKRVIDREFVSLEMLQAMI